jgi:hypothetical protein
MSEDSPCSDRDFSSAIFRLRSGWTEKIGGLKRTELKTVGLEIWVWGKATQSQIDEVQNLGGVCRFDGQKTWLQAGHCGYRGQGSVIGDEKAAPGYRRGFRSDPRFLWQS